MTKKTMVSKKTASKVAAMPTRALTSKSNRESSKSVSKDEVMNAPAIKFTEQDKANFELLTNQIEIAICEEQTATFDAFCKLFYIGKSELWRVGEFRGLADYAMKKFEMNSTAVSRGTHIVERVGEQIDGKPLGVRRISPMWANFTWTKLSIMADMSEDDLKKCTPDMSFRKIKAIANASKKADELEEKQEKAKQAVDVDAKISDVDNSDNDSDSEKTETEFKNYYKVVKAFSSYSDLVDAFNNDSAFISEIKKVFDLKKTLSIDMIL